ncbi:PREDICTED: neuropeptide S [Miniopterus natalensis]|uniref:neuropeptide S n=1 Tax=Miniopterus natalensis TaxID=291302 RepID=UPI0007A6EEDA|nr:PREDICTED: neuropeptide S [Miniopterus natalensis]
MAVNTTYLLCQQMDTSFPYDPATSSLKFSLLLVLSVSTMHVFCCYPVPSPKVSGTPGDLLLLLSSGRARAPRSEGLGFLPLLEKVFAKRSFRNGVGTGMKKTPFPRAKS